MTIAARPRTMWRYKELLPVDGEPTVGRQVGGTPLIRADRLAKALGVRELYIKNDAVNHPTLSFKDRVVAVALSKAVELGFETVGCASTGNLAGSVAANAAAAGLEGVRPDPGQPGAGQGPRRHDLRREGRRHQGQLRPRQPALLADRLPVRLGLRERQPPALLRRGVEVDGLRDRRGPRLADARPRRRADGRRQPDRQAPQGVQGARAARLDRRPGPHEDVRRPGDRLQPDHQHGQDRGRRRSGRSATRTRSPRAWRSATRPTATSPAS